MKAEIRRDPDTGQWVATRPRLGFGPPECQAFDSQPEALRWLDRSINRQGSLAATAERAVRVGDIEATSRTHRRRGYW